MNSKTYPVLPISPAFTIMGASVRNRIISVLGQMSRIHRYEVISNNSDHSKCAKRVRKVVKLVVCDHTRLIDYEYQVW